MGLGRPSPKSDSDQPPPVLLPQRSSVTARPRPHPHPRTPILPRVRGPRLRRRRDGARARLCQKWSAAGGRGPVAEEPATPSRGVRTPSPSLPSSSPVASGASRRSSPSIYAAGWGDRRGRGRRRGARFRCQCQCSSGTTSSRGPIHCLNSPSSSVSATPDCTKYCFLTGEHFQISIIFIDLLKSPNGMLFLLFTVRLLLLVV